MNRQNNKSTQFNDYLGTCILLFVVLRTYLLAIFPGSFWLAQLLPLTLLLVVAKIVSDVRHYGLSRNKVFHLLLLLTAVLTLFTRDFRPFSNLLIAFSFRTWPLKKVIRQFFWIMSLVFIGVVLMGHFNVVPNHSWFDGVRYRRFLGFSNPNSGMQMALLIWSSYLYLNWQVLFQKSQLLKTIAIGMIYPTLVWHYTQSRMPLLAFAAGLFILLLHQTKVLKKGKNSFKWLFAFVPIVLAVLSVVVALVSASGNFLNHLLSMRPHLWGYMLEQTAYPVNLIGYHFNVLENLYYSGSGQTGEPLILDNAYLYLLAVRGILMFVVMLLLYAAMFYKSIKQERSENVFLLTTLLVYGFGENIFISIGTNVLFFMLYWITQSLTHKFFKKEKHDSKNKKILYVITRSDWGGAQVHLFDLLTEMTKRGVVCEVAVGERGELYDRLVAQGIQVYYLKHLIHEIKPLTDVRAVFELNKVMKLANADVVHLHSTKAGWIGRLSALCVGSPVIFTAHGWCFTEGATGMRKRFGKTIEKFLIPMTDAIICVSEYDRNLALKQKVAEKEALKVVYNGVASIKMNEADKTPSERPDVFKVMMTARFAEPKDQASVIEAFAELPENMELYLAGDGPNLEMCKQLANERKLSQRVHFLGQRSDVAQWLNTMDAFVLSSHYEGLPISIIEAMSAGLPIVASDVGGVSELVHHNQNGYLFPEGDTAKLTQLLKTLDQKQKKQLGQESFKLYEEKFTLEKCVQGTWQVYESVWEEKGCDDEEA